MKLSEIKKIKELTDEWRNVVEQILNGEPDIQTDNYRFIDDDFIDDIMQEELGSDEYILGCFNAWFLADILNIDQDVIVAMQQAEAYEALGKLVLSLGKIEELQVAYRQADGYGHHFAHYDHNDTEETFNGSDYHIFRIN